MTKGMNRPVVRLRGKGRLQATPYLREWCPRLPAPVSAPDGHSIAVDLGCGNGRNSDYLKKRGYWVWSCDMKPDYPGAHQWTAGHQLRLLNESVSLFCCQYVLMFLTDREIALALDEINRVTQPGGHVIIEIQPDVRDGHPVNLDRVFGYLVGIGHWNSAGSVWRAVHFSKERCVLKRGHLFAP